MSHDPVRRQARPSLVPWIAGAAAVLFALGWVLVRLGGTPSEARSAVPAAAAAAGPVATVRVRTEPDGLPVTLDGVPLAAAEVRLPAQPPYGTLRAELECRVATRALGPADAGGEVVLVTDPVRAPVAVDPGLEGATVSWNGEPPVPAPATFDADLCRENRVEVAAPGFRPAVVVLPAGATPTSARTALAAASLAKIPEGTLRLDDPGFPVSWSVDGEPVRGRTVRLPEGGHEVRAVSEPLLLDRTLRVEVRAGETARAALDRRKAKLVVQAFPANCRVALRRGPKAPWRDVDDTPLTMEVAPGPLHVRVTHVPTGQTQEREVDLRPGANAPVRFAFGQGA
jgi:hypothetical protein